jgi:hypothetical protein
MFSIGSTLVRAAGFVQTSGLSAFQAILPAREFRIAAERAGCLPRRKRILIPEVVAWLMMLVALHSASMTQGLLQAWSWVRSRSPIRAEKVTEEAFCEARGRLKLRFWRILWDRLVVRYEKRFGRQMLWKRRFRVLAADGSDVDLPNVPALVRFFTCPRGSRGQSKRPQGRLVAICSVMTGFCVAFKFLSLRFSEHVAFQHLTRYLRKNDLVLLDRGFFSLRHHPAHPAARSRLLDAPEPTDCGFGPVPPVARLCRLAGQV